MSKFVGSLLNFFGSSRGRAKEEQLREGRSRGKRSRRALLEADSFVFLPGEDGTFWGEVLESEEVTAISSLAADYSVHCEIRRRAKTVDDNALRPKVVNRRLSGTLLKARKSLTEDVEDRLAVRDPRNSHHDRPKSDSSGRYVYDRLIRVPVRKSQRSSGVSQQYEDLDKPSEQPRSLVFEIRCDTNQSPGYSQVAEYAMPADAIDWEEVRKKALRAGEF